MDNTVLSQKQSEQEQEADPLIRLIYAIGIILTAFGGVVPGHIAWSTVGIAMVAFCYIYE